ncbi:MAG: MurR/RpiR family transcriptional regulator, partial [Enterobacteriaceae bacterium]
MSYEIDIISRISTGVAEMSASEKKIARFIQDDIHGVIALPIAQLAAKSGVSQATITRFARMIGCKDVRDLKVRLAQSLAIGQRFIHEVPDLEGSAALYESIINILNINKKVLDEGLIHKAAQWIGQARQTIAVGMGGGSTICAQEIQHRFFRLGVPVCYYNDG